jgi:hypothetical protein
MDTIKRALRISVVEGVFAQVHINLTTGMFLTSLALSIGLNDIGIGFLSAIPAFFTGFGFLAIYFVHLLKNRRTLCVFASGLGRGLFLIIGLMLLAGMRVHHGLFLFIIALHNVLLNLASNAWLSWMSDLVPSNTRGRYFGARNTILSIIGMMVNIVGGRILDLFSAVGNVARGLGSLLTSAAVSSTIAAGVLSTQPEPPVSIEPPRPKKMLFTPFKDHDFRSLLRFVSFWYLLAGIASPFYVVHMLKNLQMTYSQVALYSIIAGSTTILFQIIWGQAIDRWKSKPVLTINFFCAASLPLFWLFATKDFLLPIWIDAFLTGIFWTGINLSLFNIVFSLTEEKRLKESYFAVFASITGVFAFVASSAGGLIAQALAHLQVHVFGLSLVNYQLMFFFASCIRFLSIMLLVRVKEKEAYPALRALQLMGDYTVRRLVLYKGLVLNTLRFNK